MMKRYVFIGLFILFGFVESLWAIKFISKIPFLKDEALGVFVKEDYVYLAHGEGGLCIIDVKDKEHPYLVGFYDTDGIAENVFTEKINDKIYSFIADEKGGLKIIDVSDPYKLALMSEYKTNITNACSIWVKDRYAYLLDRNNGLIILDVSNPQLPDLQSEYPLKDCYDIYVESSVEGSFAYIAAWNKLVIIDVIDPRKPKLISACETPGNACGVFKEKDYVYVADHIQGLTIVDVATLEEPTVVGNYNPEGPEKIELTRAVWVLGNCAYIACSEKGIYEVNISNPSNPTYVKRVLAECAYDLHIKDDYIYTADSTEGLKIHNLDLSLISRYYTTGELHNVYIKGNYAYLAEGWSGLTIADITNPFSPKVVSRLRIMYTANIEIPETTTAISVVLTGRVLDVAVKGRFAYLAVEDAGFVVVNVDNPKYPFIIGYVPWYYVEIGEDRYRYDIEPYAIHIKGDYAYLASNEWQHIWNPKKQAWEWTGTVFPSMTIINIEKPTNPYHENSTKLPQSPPMDVFCDGDYVYSATHDNDHDKGLHVSHIIRPDYIITYENILKHLTDKPRYVDGVYVKDNIAYLACNESGLYIADVKDPKKPVFLGKCKTNGKAYQVVVRGNYAYVADREGGVAIIDIRNPKEPRLLDACSINDVKGIHLKEEYIESYIYAADKSGFFILDSEIYYINGYVRDEGGLGLGGVLVKISGRDIPMEATCTTTYTGFYQFLDLRKGWYDLTAKKPGWKISPEKYSYEPLETNLHNQDFTGVRIYFIKGKVKDKLTDEGVKGVLLTLEGDGKCMTYTTTESGEYCFEELIKGSYTVTPYKEKCRFTPFCHSYQPLEDDRYRQDFEVTKLYDIKGTITDFGGNSIPDVELTLYVANQSFMTTTTNIGGVYQFLEVPQGTYTLKANKTGYGFCASGYGYYLEPVKFAPLNEDKEQNFISGKIYSISGTVTATFTGTPVVDVKINLEESLPEIGEFSTFTYTNQEGKFKFERIFGSGSYIIIPEKENWRFQPTSTTKTNFSEDVTDINFIGTELLKIEGTVTYDSKPLREVVLKLLCDGTEIGTYTTDTSGKYRFITLESGRSYRLIPQKLNWEFAPQEFSTILQANVIQDFKGSPLVTFSIIGTITAWNNNQPIQGVEVKLSGDKSTSTFTNASGTYSFIGLLPGFNYKVTPEKINYTFVPASHTFPNIDGTKTANFKGYKYLSITGTITNYFKKELIQDVTIRLTGKNVKGEEINKSAHSNQNGEYSFHSLIAGTYTITPSKERYKFYPESTMTILINEDLSGVNFYTAWLYQITGKVIKYDNTQEGVGGVTIELSGDSPFPGAGTITATVTTAVKTGEYTLTGILEGTYTLKAIKENWIFQPKYYEYKPLEEDKVNQDFIGTPTYSVYGQVLDEQKNPIEKVRIELRNAISTYTYTNKDGKYKLTDIHPGTYTLNASFKDYAFYYGKIEVPITIVIDKDKEINLSAKPLYTISGYIKDNGGNPIKNIKIELTGATQTQTHTDAHGFYQFESLFEGAYTITPKDNNYLFEPKSISVYLKENKKNQNFVAFIYKVKVKPGEIKIQYEGEGADRGYFNPNKGEKLKIVFNASSAGVVKIKIYSLLGELVRELEKRTQGNEPDSIDWYGKNQDQDEVASGIYIIKIEGPGLNLIKKVCIIK